MLVVAGRTFAVALGGLADVGSTLAAAAVVVWAAGKVRVADNCG